MNRQIVGDLAGLPASGWGTKSQWFWGIVGFMAIEGMGFLLALGCYLYLMSGAKTWPMDAPAPDLFYGSLLTVVMLLSLLPNFWVGKVASQRKLGPTLVGLVVMSLVAVACLAIRAFEFQHLNVRWDSNAYGSIVWALLLLHSTHLVTDFADTVVLAVFCFTHEVDEERFSDVDINVVYWAFVVAAWLPIYALIYWAPRLR
jgi:heme/copper-type cytochrome/quinol oxidase subunit 3